MLEKIAGFLKKNISKNNKEKELAEMIREAKNITILTGAGVSVASGIPDFRTSQGAFWLADKERMNIMSASYRDKNPKEFWPKFKEIFDVKIGKTFEPNISHMFLAGLEEMGKNVTIITQNVDGLHQDAGSSNVLELHGTMKHAICPKCKTKYGVEYVVANDVPRCNRLNSKNKVCDFILIPDVVLFGDMVRSYDKAEEATANCDLMIVMGSSLQVPPASFLPLDAARKRKSTAIINLHETSYDHEFDIVIHGDLGKVINKIKKAL